jgi:hypothetical protein
MRARSMHRTVSMRARFDALNDFDAPGRVAQ